MFLHVNFCYFFNCFCHDRCKNAKCNWDGGDCTQLCDCDPFKELRNDECNLSCSASYCLYDGYDCLHLGYVPIECQNAHSLGIHDCNISRIGDGWCDTNCRKATQCGFDRNDCDDGNCRETKQYGSIVADDYTTDSHIEQIEIDKWWDFGVAFNVFDYVEVANESSVIASRDLDDDGLLHVRETIVAALMEYQK